MNSHGDGCGCIRIGFERHLVDIGGFMSVGQEELTSADEERNEGAGK